MTRIREEEEDQRATLQRPWRSLRSLSTSCYACYNFYKGWRIAIFCA